MRLRCGGSYGAYIYKRSSPHIQAFKRACIDRVNAYVKAKAWCVRSTFLIPSLSIIHARLDDNSCPAITANPYAALDLNSSAALCLQVRGAQVCGAGDGRAFINGHADVVSSASGLVRNSSSIPSLSSVLHASFPMTCRAHTHLISRSSGVRGQAADLRPAGPQHAQDLASQEAHD